MVPISWAPLAVLAVAERLVQLVAEKADANEDAAPVIDREGGPGGKKRLNIV